MVEELWNVIDVELCNIIKGIDLDFEIEEGIGLVKILIGSLCIWVSKCFFIELLGIRFLMFWCLSKNRIF